jgi:DNA repair exonuclease SbcCD ATPase subunit
MKIKSIEFKNIKSYGHKLQRIEFDDNSSLILLCGINGSGKSAIKDAIEICIYGKCTGRTGKRMSIEKVTNRINRHGYSSVEFLNNKNDEIKINRFIKPNSIEIFKNSENVTEIYNNDKDRENLVGYPYEIFKSFLFLDMNEFKNFTSLTADDKRNLLNKLFKLEKIDKYLSVTKELLKDNEKNIEHYTDLIDDTKIKIEEYDKTLKSFNITTNKADKIKELKNLILSKQPEFNQLKEDINKASEESNKININLGKLSKMKSDTDNKISKLEYKCEDLKEKIDIFKSGYCTVCNSELKDEFHLQKLNEIIVDLDKIEKELFELNDYRTKIVVKDTSLRNQSQKIWETKNINQSNFDNLKVTLSSLTRQINILKEFNQEPIIEFQNKLEGERNKLKEYKITLSKLNNRNESYTTLLLIFSDDGIRKNIIRNIIKPIQHKLKQILNKLECEFNVTLNDNFDVDIFERELLEIDSETTSKGEFQKINIAIALSYLANILEVNHTNIIFLDELFDGMDAINVDLTLKTLRDIAKTYNINIIVVHHSEMKLENFDTIIKVNKNVFSDIEIIKN